MPVVGANLVAKNIRAYGGGFLKTVNEVMTEIRFLLDDRLTKNIARKDFSLKELADLDHPFARRHGSEGIPVYDPYWMVHSRTGRLINSVDSGTERASITAGKLTASAFVRLDPTIAPHALHVVFGTSKMIPRPVVTGSGQQVSPVAMKLLKTKLKSLTISFRAR